MTIALLPAALGAASGGLVGFSLGLVGGGGSILAVPLLIYLVGVPGTHVAIGTSAVAVAANAAFGLVGHARAGTVRWPCAAVFSLAGMAGAFAGSALGRRVDGRDLLVAFALLMLAIAVLMLRRREPTQAREVRLNPAMAPKLVGTGLAVGLLSGFFGIGGGFLIVPGLILATGMPMLQAVGTSLVAVTSLGATTAASYAAAGLVDWAMAGIFVAGGFLGTLLGMRVGRHLAGRRGALTKLFSGLIILVAVYVLARGLGMID